MTRILVVEDEVSLREDLVDYLKARGFAAEGASSAAECRAALNGPDIAVVILDIGLPDGNGLDLAREVRTASKAGIIMLTSHGSVDARVAGLESGADVYLVKHTSMREIDATVRSLLRRLAESPVAPRSWRLDDATWLLTAPDGTETKLTSTEMMFLTTVLTSPGRRCTRDDILRGLGREPSPAETRALDAIVRRLRRKVEQQTHAKLPLAMIYGGGYVFTAPVEMQSPTGA